MTLHTLAHLSDLHFGQGPAREAMARALCQALIESTIGHVVVTGDITNKGGTWRCPCSSTSSPRCSGRDG